MATIFRFSAVAVVLATLSGCAPGTTLKTVPVTGKITYKGQPLEGATVAFVKEQSEGANFVPASGVTDATGMYKLVSFQTPAKPVDGAVPGSYKVIVTKRAGATGPGAAMGNIDPAQMGEKLKTMSPEEMRKMGGQGGGIPMGGGSSASAAALELAGKSQIPDRYSLANQTDLTAEVKDGGPQEFNFELKD
ncbi:MAG TPA: hypothetical protein VG826_26960 [Pirellulales bacterium]|nr:hypothetical protein [Pirellulales bacterium]